MISVIVPCYNCKDYILQTLESIVLQDFDDIEVIVVDDCSSDGSFELVSGIYGDDPRFVLGKNPCNMGVAYTRNEAFRLSSGKYIALLDSDDVWESCKLSIQMEALEKSGADICCSGAMVISFEGENLNRLRSVPDVITFDKLLRNNMIVNSTVLMKRCVMERIDFRSTFFHEDYVFWLEAMKNGFTFVGVNKPLIKYRLGGRSKNKIHAAKNRWSIYRRFLNFGILKSSFYMIHYVITAICK